MRLAQIGHVDRPARASKRQPPPLGVLHPQEEREHLLEAPPGVAEGGPVVVVEPIAARVHLRVDRGAAADRLAARPVELPPAHLFLGSGRVVPVTRPLEQLGEGRRHPHHEPAPRAARLEQQDLGPGVLGQAGSERAARGAGADDDVVVLHGPPLFGADTGGPLSPGGF